MKTLEEKERLVECLKPHAGERVLIVLNDFLEPGISSVEAVLSNEADEYFIIVYQGYNNSIIERKIPKNLILQVMSGPEVIYNDLKAFVRAEHEHYNNESSKKEHR